MTPLVEREREVAALAALLDAAPAGEGRVAWIEGPAGIGKSALLAEARRHAAGLDTRVLAARGSELEREFPFGVVRQLFEALLADPAARERALGGAAAPAAAVFGAPDAVAGDVSFAALHGLFWLAPNLAAEGPLVLDIDELHSRERLGEAADEAFCTACHEATGGNPLFLRQLLTALEADHVQPDAAHAGVVLEIGPRAEIGRASCRER